MAKESRRERRTDRERQSEEGKRTTPIRPRHEEAAITSALVIERKWLKVLLGSRKRLLSSTTTTTSTTTSNSTSSTISSMSTATICHRFVLLVPHFLLLFPPFRFLLLTSRSVLLVLAIRFFTLYSSFGCTASGVPASNLGGLYLSRR